MYLTDYHTHSQISFDSTAALADMAAAAAAAGMEELCVTDHCDLLDEDGKPVRTFDWPAALEQFHQALPHCPDGLTLRLGLELGMAHVDPEAARDILSQPELDFVIGSIHNLSPQAGGGDFYYLDHSKVDRCYATLDDYFGSMALLSATGFYDVLGHIIYPLRYMTAPVTLERYWEMLDAILRTVAEQGKGIELNTYTGHTLRAWRPVLKRYRDCGGEIVTLGSDAHAPEGVGRGIHEACGLLREAGFRYTATYRRHVPQFHKL